MYPNSNKSISSNSGYNYLRKPSTNKISSIKENEKTSQIVGNNIVYNTPKITSNYNSNANPLPKEDSSINFNRKLDRDDNKLLRENKELKEEIIVLRKVRKLFTLIRKIMIRINSLEKKT
jgi:hypothetical protein